MDIGDDQREYIFEPVEVPVETPVEEPELEPAESS